jgi:pantetheine-phosphate adenylyltransferase
MITADQEGPDDPLLVKKDYREVLESIDVRIAAVREFLELFKRAVKYDIVPIADVYGPTASDPNIQVLIVSKETVSGANASEFIQISCETQWVHTCVHLDADLLFDLVYGAWSVLTSNSFVCAVAEARAEKSLPALRTFVIDVISGNAEEWEELAREKDTEKLKVAKIGSTYIRRWIVEVKVKQGLLLSHEGTFGCFCIA